MLLADAQVSSAREASSHGTPHPSHSTGPSCISTSRSQSACATLPLPSTTGNTMSCTCVARGLVLGFRTAHNAAALALPPDARGGDDDGRSADAKDLAERAGCGRCEELRHRQGALGGVQVERWRQVWERGRVWAVREEGEGRGARHAQQDRAVQRGRHHVERCEHRGGTGTSELTCILLHS
jgi:hypothetical protein